MNNSVQSGIPPDFDIALSDLESLRDELSSHKIEGLSESAADTLATRISYSHNRLARILQVQSSNLELNLLSDIALMLARAVSLEEVISAILDGLHRIVPYDAAGLFIPGEEPGTLSEMVVRGYRNSRLDDVKLKVNEGIVGWVISNGEAVNVPDVSLDSRYISARSRTRSEMAVPIISGEEVVGCFNVESDQLATFSDTNLNLMNDLASHAAMAIERSRTHDALVAASEVERELQIARDIQVALLPGKPPSVDKYDFSGLNVPSRRVGGDYYDFIPINHHSYGLVIADVAGKGVPAGLIMSGLRAAIRTRIETTYSIQQIISRINNFLHDSTGPESFVTVFYGVLDTETRRLTYVNAGHIAPLLFQSDGKIERLGKGGALLGVIRDAEYEEGIAYLEDNSLLALFTDGITEAGVESGEEFGEQRVIDIIKDCKDKAADIIAQNIEREAAIYNRGRGENDDRTVIIVKRL